MRLIVPINTRNGLFPNMIGVRYQFSGYDGDKTYYIAHNHGDSNWYCGKGNYIAYTPNSNKIKSSLIKIGGIMEGKNEFQHIDLGSNGSNLFRIPGNFNNTSVDSYDPADPSNIAFWGDEKSEDPQIKSDYSSFEIAEFITQNGLIKNYITFDPNKEEKRAIKEFMQTNFIYPLFISNVFLDITCDFKGTSLFLYEGYCAFVLNGDICSFKLSPKTNYLKIFKEGIKQKMGKKQYIEILENKAVMPKEEFRGIRAKYNEIKKQTEDYVRELKVKASGFAKAKKRIAMASTFKAPKEISDLIESGLKYEKQEVANVETLRRGYISQKTVENEEKQNIEFIKESANNVSEDYKKVKGFLKSGVIEKLELDKGVISWTYPPLALHVPRKINIFLGRVKVSLTDKVEIKFISYPVKSKNRLYYGTWHCYGQGGREQCLGSVQRLLSYAAACKSVASLILIVKDYLTNPNSQNENSKYHNPEVSGMAIDNPTDVIDDSFKVYLENKVKKELAKTKVLEVVK